MLMRLKAYIQFFSNIFAQVLARFEGFPTQKLETLRTAAALHLKLDSIVTNLKNWKVEGPLSQQLDKIEHYFIKVCLYSATSIIFSTCLEHYLNFLKARAFTFHPETEKAL